MKIKPLADKIVVKPLEVEEKTKSGLLLTAASKEKPPVGEVIAVGPGGVVNGDKIEMVVKPGDRIVYSKAPFATIEVVLEDETFIMLRQNEVLGIIED